MGKYHTWLMDLDDTLQIAPLSWANIHLFPAIIARTGVKPDRETFETAYNRAEMLYAAGQNNDALGADFFQTLGWNVDVKTEVMDRFEREYHPALFDDTLPFLEWVTGQSSRIYMTSNSKWARGVSQMLGIERYFTDIINPAGSGAARKPDRAMWDYLLAHTPLTGPEGVVLVGNNMSTDAIFAQNCGLDCIIVDRYGRFTDMPARTFRVTSLNEIPALVG